jgi:ADP-ribose pyrophosphatase
MKNRFFEVLKREELYQGDCRLDRYHVRHERMADGGSDSYAREVFTIGPVSAVLPYDPVRDEIVLIEQFRVGAMIAGEKNPWILEPPAGLICPPDTPEKTARTEAREEARCVISELEPICRMHPSPGNVSQMTWVYAGRTSTEKVGGICSIAEVNEETRPLVFSVKNISGLLADERVVNGVTIIALQWMLLNRDLLHKKWAALPPVPELPEANTKLAPHP